METCAWRSGLQGREVVRQWGGGFLLVPALAMKVQVGWYLIPTTGNSFGWIFLFLRIDNFLDFTWLWVGDGGGGVCGASGCRYRRRLGCCGEGGEGLRRVGRFGTAMVMVEGVVVGEVGGCETLAETWQGLKLGVDGWCCLCLAFVSVGGGDEVGWEICRCDDGNGFGGIAWARCVRGLV